MKTPRRRFLTQLFRTSTACLASLLGLGILAHVFRREKRSPTLAPGEPEVLRPTGALSLPGIPKREPNQPEPVAKV